jgi:hypothetical protein
LEIKTKSGAVSRVKLPIEIWQRNKTWTFAHDSTEEIETITIDPDRVLPDVNSENNVWTAGKSELEKAVVVDAYLGKFSSTQIPIKITLSDLNGELMLEATGQQTLPLESLGKDKFGFPQAGLTIQFTDDKKSFELKFGANTFKFIRD